MNNDLRARKTQSMPHAATCTGVALALTLSLAPAPALAADGATTANTNGVTASDSQAQAAVSLRGIDTLSVGGDSFDLATVVGLGGSTLYADVTVNGTVKQQDLPYTYDRVTDEAGVVSLSAKASYVAAHSGAIGISFHTKDADGANSAALLNATVYAVALRVNGQAIGSVENSIIGIRTCPAADATQAFEAPRLVVRDGKTYRLASSSAAATPSLVDGVLYVDYEAVDEAGVSASVTYVDENGAVLLRDDLGTLSAGQEQTAAVRDTVEANNRVYVPISKMPTVTVSAASPEVVVHCLPRTEASQETRTATINYVSADGTQLMRDKVDVGVGGYTYAPPTVFSQARDGSVERYVLSGGSDSRGASWDADAASSLTLAFDGAPEITLVYEAQAANITYTVNFALVTPADGGGYAVQVDSSESATVSEAAAASVSLPATITRDGETYTRVGDEDALTYSWADLNAGRMLSDTVYYTRSDVQPASAYDVTVRYVDVISGNELGSEVLSCSPDGEALSISGPESLEVEGATYQRLTGQEAAISHRYYAPYRTYTIYYAQPGAVSEGDTTVVRTDVIDGGVRYYEVNPAGGTVTTTTANGTTTTGGLSASTPYTTVVTDNAADSSAATQSDVIAPNGESAYEERIADEETPLASADEGVTAAQEASMVPAGIAAAAIAAVAAVCVAVMAFVRRSGRKQLAGTDDGSKEA